MTFHPPTKCRYRWRCLAPCFRRKQFTITQQLSMSSSSSGITADTRVVASQKQRWPPMFIFIVLQLFKLFFPIDIMSSISYFISCWGDKKCDVMGGSNLMSQWRYFGKNSLETLPKMQPQRTRLQPCCTPLPVDVWHPSYPRIHPTYRFLVPFN